MKKIIITTAVVAAATFSFYIHENAPATPQLNNQSITTSYENILDLGIGGSYRMDIGQADIR